VLATAAFAGQAAAADYAPATPMFSWSGVYGGAQIGYGWGEYDVNSSDIIYTDDVFDPANPVDYVYPGFNSSSDVDGVVGGLYGGANFQLGGFVFGLDADYSWSGITGDGVQTDEIIATVGGVDGTLGGFGEADADVDWLAHVRGRIGYGWDRFLIYAAGGLAVAGLSNDLGVTTPSFILSGNDNGNDSITGWTVGGGVEWAFTDNLVVRAEYLYDQFDDVSFGNYSIFDDSTGDTFTRSVEGDLSVNIFRVGLSYKFGGMF
jgi:outer membrane immunogenic protein